MLFLFLMACGGSERELSIEESTSNPEVWTPGGDDTGGSVGSWDSQDPIACGSELADTEDSGENALDPLFCMRLSPEPGDEGLPCTTSDDTGVGISDTGGLFNGGNSSVAVPPPCGYFNLLGSIAVSGEPDAPALLYCDADIPGGTRFVQVDGTSERLRTQMLASETCYADPDTGAMFPVDGGWLVVWIDLQSGPGILSGFLGSRGQWSEDMSQVLFEATPRRLRAVGDHLLIIDDLDRLWSIPVSEGAIGGTPLLVGNDARSVGATDTEEGFAVVTCGDRMSGPRITDSLEDGPRVTLVEDGAVSWSTDLLGPCFFDARPSIAWQSDHLAVAWEQETGGTVVLLDESGTETNRLELGGEARTPQVTELDSGFLVVDGSGELRKLATDGSVLGNWQHPDIVHHSGNMAGLRLQVTDELWGFTFIGSDIEVTPAGHANTFYYLEVSAVSVP